MSSDQSFIDRLRARFTASTPGQWVINQPRWKVFFVLLGVIVFATISTMLLLVLLVRAGYILPMPTYAELASVQNHQASEIYDRDNQLLGKYFLENRTNADAEELPDHLVHALIATEDARFFEHSGIDLKSLARVLLKSILLSDERSGGGSTISQQLAKNLYPRRDLGTLSIIIHKIREMLIARRLEHIYDKNKIIQLYLNTVPFEGNAFGVKVAARTFFDKSLPELSVDEGAILVGMLKANTYYNPIKYPERAKERRNIVLRQMQKFGYLDEKELADFTQREVVTNYQAENHHSGIATYFREHLRLEAQALLKEIERPDGRDFNLYTDGLRLTTTLDQQMQHYAEEALREHLLPLQDAFLREWKDDGPWLSSDFLIKQTKRYRNLVSMSRSWDEILDEFNQEKVMTVFDWQVGVKEVVWSPLDSLRHYASLLRSGMLVVDPTSGQTLAWVGGMDHRFIQYDHVKSERQIGSLMKPIVYAAALQGGTDPCQLYQNQKVRYADYQDWQPRNSDGAYGGYYSMAGALRHSVNTVAVSVALETGLPLVKKLAHELGIDSEIPLEPAIALGAVEASLWEMLAVYSTFANQGSRPDLHILTKIETMDGEVLWTRDDAPQPPVLTDDEAAVMNQLLQSVVDSGTAERIRKTYGLRGEIAGKTGTTQNQSDGWFVGYTPRLAAGAWVGGEFPNIHFRSIRSGQGANSALPIWARFMGKLQRDPELRKYLGGNFQAVQDTNRFSLDCPHFLPELPLLQDSLLDQQALAEFGKAVHGIDPDQLGEVMRRTPRRSSESLSEYSKRIRRRNARVVEKRNRKKKRKAFIDKVLGRKRK